MTDFLRDATTLPNGKTDAHPLAGQAITAAEWNLTMQAIYDLRDGFFEQAIDVRNYGAVGDGVTDDTDAIVAAVAAAVASGNRRVHFPACPGGYRVNSASAHASYGQTAVDIPSNFIVSGEGYASRILMTGVANEPYPATGAFSVFQVAAHAKKILFVNLWFIGENDDEEDFQTPAQNESACIDFSATGGAPYPEDVVIHNCTCEYLFGFSFHQVAGTRCHVTFCNTRWCANGINCNADYAIQSHNTIFHSEGFESAGEHIQICNNVMIDCIATSIAIGGDTTSLVENPGCMVNGNVIDGTTGFGIVTSDGFVDGEICDNTIMHCTQGGIIVQADPPGTGGPGSIHISGRNLIANNTVVDCCEVGGGNVIGIDIESIGSNIITGNRSVDTGDPAWAQQIGIYANCPNNFITGNWLDCASNQDILLGAAAVDTRMGENKLVNEKIQMIAGATILHDARVGLALTDIVESSRLSTVVNGLDRFRRLVSGELQWHDASNTAPDTNLYRSAANALKTDDKLVAALGIGVGNSAAATTPGTVTKKMEVFDASGASLGFVAIYDAIT